MKPTLRGDEYLMVNKLTYFRVDLERLSKMIPFWNVDTKEEKYLPFAHPPERGDVIVFHAPHTDKDFVKRVVGLPGEAGRDTGWRGIYKWRKIGTGKAWSNSTPARPGTASRDCHLTAHSGQAITLFWETIGMTATIPATGGRYRWKTSSGKSGFVYWPFSDLPVLGPFFERAEGK